MRVRSGALLAGVAAALLAGCGLEPGAPLISLREEPATVLPSEVPPVRPDGFPVILADPVTVAGLPRTAEEVAAAEARLEEERLATQAAAASLAREPSNVAALAARGRTHVEERRRLIEASGQPQTGAAPRDLPAVAAAPRRQRPPEPLDPAAPAPRAVGTPPFLPVASD